MTVITIPPLSPFPGRGAAPEDYIAQADTTMQELPTVISRMNEMSAAFNLGAGVLTAGYLPPVLYGVGLQITSALQSVEYAGTIYAPLLSALPFTTSGVFEVSNFRVVQGVVAGELAAVSGSGLVGNDGETVAESFAALQLANYSALRAYVGPRRSAYVTGTLGATTADGIAGMFIRTVGAANRSDDGGSYFVDALGRGWARQYSGRLLPEWWGGLRDALQYGPENAAYQLGLKTYDILGLYNLDASNLSTAVYNTKRNIKLYGSGMPVVNDAGVALTAGTVIQGLFFNMARGLELYDLGIDVGPEVVARNAARLGVPVTGAYLEGLVLGTILTYPTPSPKIVGIKFDRICVLGKLPTIENSTFKHMLLIENVSNFAGGLCRVYGGYHGAVFKSSGGVLHSLDAFGVAVNSWIIKGDAGNNAEDITVNSIRTDSLDGMATTRAGRGLINPASVGGFGLGEVRRITIGTINSKNVSLPFQVQQSPGELGRASNIHVGFVAGESCDGLIDIDGSATRVSIGRHRGTNLSGGGVVTRAGCAEVDIGDGEVVSAGGYGYSLAGDVQHGRIRADSCVGYGVYQNGAIVSPDRISGSGNTFSLISGLFPIKFAPLNWTNTPALDFRAAYYDQNCYIGGTLSVGPGAAIGALTPGFRPRVRKTFPITGIVASTIVHGILTVDIDGTVSVDNWARFAGGEVYFGLIKWSVTQP